MESSTSKSLALLNLIPALFLWGCQQNPIKTKETSSSTKSPRAVERCQVTGLSASTKGLGQGKCPDPGPRTCPPFVQVPLHAKDVLGNPHQSIFSQPPAYASQVREARKIEGRFTVDNTHMNTPILFQIHADDGVRLIIENSVVLDQFNQQIQWENPGSIRNAQFVPTRSGDFIFRIEYSNTIDQEYPLTDGIVYLPSFLQDSQPVPVQEKQDPPPSNPTTGKSDPVYINTGDFFLINTDLTIPGRGFDFEFRRYYRSQSNYSGPLGYGWEFNYNKRIALNKNGSDLNLFHGHREPQPFRDVSFPFDDTFPQVSGTEWTAPPGLFSKILLNGDGTYRLVESDGLEYHFFALSGVTSGKLKKIRDRHGNEMTFQYNVAGYLSSVIDTLGRMILFTTDGIGRILQIVDFAGRVVSYSYDFAGDLRSVTSPSTLAFPAGQTTSYSYSSGFSYFFLNHNLLSIMDAKGQTYLTNFYGTNPLVPDTFDKVTNQSLGNGNMTFVYFPALLMTRLTDRNGNIIEYGYTPQGNPTFVREFTNRDVRPTDPAFYLTTFDHNANFDRTKTVLPRGNTIEQEFDTLNPSIWSQGNLLRKIRRPFDGAADGASLIETMTYEPTFNQVATGTDAKGKTSTFSYDLSGNLTTVQFPAITVPVAQAITESFTFNSFGQPITHTKGEGNQDCMDYFTSGPSLGYLKTIRRDCLPGGLNLTTEYTYDTVGNVTSVKDPKGQTRTFLVDALNQVTKATAPSPLNYEITFAHDANGNIVQTNIQNRDENGTIDAANPQFTGTYTYDLMDQITSVTDEVNTSSSVTTQYEYDANENLSRVTKPQGNKVFYTYDERDLPYQITDGEGTAQAATTTLDYNLNQSVERVTDPRGNAAVVTYDLFDRHTSATDAMGNVETIFYDNNSNVTRRKFDGRLNHVAATNSRLADISFSYDEIDRTYKADQAFFNPATQAAYLDGLNTITRFPDRNGRVTKIVNDNGHQTLFQYDAADRFKKWTDHLGNEKEAAYDSNSNVLQLIEREIPQAGGATETYTTTAAYDAFNRRTQVTDNMGHSRQFKFDSRNNLKLVTDAKGNTTHFSYDGLSRVLQTTIDLRTGGGTPGSVFDTIVTQKAWDTNSRLSSDTDDNGHTTSYSYDSIDRPTLITFSDGTSKSFAYDANSNVLTYTDQNGTIASNTFDVLNRVTARGIILGAGIGGTTSESYGYDGLSRNTLLSNNYSTNLFTYDSVSNIRTEDQNGQVVSSTFDGASNRTQISYPGGRAVVQEFDQLERLRRVLSPNPTEVARYDYIGGGTRVGTKTLGNGTDLLKTYDQDRRPVRLLHRNGGTTIGDFLYGYDEENNRTYEQKAHAPFSGAGDRYTYDSLYRLINAKVNLADPVGGTGTPVTNLTYNLDGVHNRMSVVNNSTTETYTMNAGVPPSDYQVNQYTTVGTSSYTYDSNGNVTYDGKRNLNYQYNYRNQMIQAMNATTSQVVAQYTYDAFGRRIERNVSGTVTKFILDGIREIEERDGGGALVADYVYGSRLDEILMMSRGGQQYYFHANALGSTMQVTNSSGSVVERYDYDPYGAVTMYNGSGSVISTSAIGNPLLFTGRRYDAETGLYFNRLRHYDPILGRFTSKDPIGDWGDSTNLGNGFTYAGNNPSNLTDPLGLQEKSDREKELQEELDRLKKEIDLLFEKLKEIEKLRGKEEISGWGALTEITITVGISTAVSAALTTAKVAPTAAKLGSAAGQRAFGSAAAAFKYFLQALAKQDAMLMIQLIITEEAVLLPIIAQYGKAFTRKLLEKYGIPLAKGAFKKLMEDLTKRFGEAAAADIFKKALLEDRELQTFLNLLENLLKDLEANVAEFQKRAEKALKEAMGALSYWTSWLFAGFNLAALQKTYFFDEVMDFLRKRLQDAMKRKAEIEKKLKSSSAGGK